MNPRVVSVVFLAFVSFACSEQEEAKSNSNILPTQIISVRYLGDGGLNTYSSQVYARASWQDFGISVRKGDRIYVKSTGNWSSGEVKIGSDTSRTEIMQCDARGCNSDWLIPYDDADFTFDEIVLTNLGNPASVIHNIFYTIENIERNAAPSFRNLKAGYLDGRLDGQRICFSADNKLLGSETANLSLDGYWRDQRVYWEDLKDEHTNNTALANALNNMVNLYKNAKCSAPPTFLQVENLIRSLRTAGLLWDGTEPVYEPVYFVDVPSSNYRQACNSTAEIILSYQYGRPHDKILKNECAAAERNSLVMKILGTDESLDQLEAYFVGKDFEGVLLEVPKTGRIYFRSNDLDRDISNNSGKLQVTLSLE